MRNFRIILFVGSFLSLLACRQAKIQLNDVSEVVVYPHPEVVKAVQPVPVFLNACPKPQTITVPSRPSQYKMRIQGGFEMINLSPPEPKLAGFSVHMQNYTTDQGLALDAIASSCRDHFGNLWFGTVGGGVSRYDGKSFVTFTTAQGLGNNRVFSMLEDTRGNMWFGTNGGGVSCYDGRKFTTYTTAQGLADYSVFSIIEDRNGNMWFGTNGGGVSCYDGKSFTNFTVKQGLAENKILSMLQDKSGNIWFGTFNGGVSRYDGKSFVTFTTVDGLCNNSVRSILQDKTCDIWFGTFGGGVSRYDGKSFTTISTAQGLCNNNVLSILEDKNDNLWFGTFDGGASCYSSKTGFINFTVAQGLCNNSVRSISEDKTGNIWLSTFGGGISRYDGKSFTTYTTEQGLSNNTVCSVYEDKTGNMWFGTDGGGVCKYDGKTFTAFTKDQGLGNNTVCSIIQDKKGDLWFGTDGDGVSCYDGRSFTTYTTTQGLGNNSIISILEDKTGNLWFGTNGKGVSCYDGRSFTTYTTAHGLGNNTILYMLQDKAGNIWFCTFGGGVSKYDGKSFTIFTTAQGLGNNRVWSMAEDKAGNLWFGTDGGGVSRYDGKSFTNYTTAQGLPDNTVVQLVVTKEQKIALGTNLGVAIITGFSPKSTGNSAEAIVPVQNSMSNDELKTYSPNLEIYNSKTGYPVKDINVGQNCMYIDSKGVIWAGTGSEKIGLVRFDPVPINRNTDPPTLAIQSIKISEENICWYDLFAHNDSTLSAGKTTKANRDSAVLVQHEVSTFGKVLTTAERDTLHRKFSGIKFNGISRYYPLPINLVLPYQHNHITFEFAAIEPARPYLVNYQCILDGYDKDWNPVTNKTNVTFGNISEGTYTFRLKAQNPGGTWSTPISYTFKVLPPWYRTWWAFVFYVLLLGVFVVVIVWRNGKRLSERAKYLKQKVDEVLIEIREKNKILEEKNNDIIESINYAKMIQAALLREEERLSSHLSDYFIFFKPKDIVSGDFYWALEKGPYLYLAAVDCTGHGVPGGFMSMLGVAFLNEINAGVVSLTPAEILDQLRSRVILELGQTGRVDENQDGMDMSLIRINLETKEILWSGANNPLWIIKNTTTIEGTSFLESAPDKQPIGYYPTMQPFTNQSLKVEKDSILYLFTDGYTDQIGGQTDKKFMKIKFKQLIMDIYNKPLTEQKRILEKIHTDWKGNNAQTDDMLVMGIRI